MTNCSVFYRSYFLILNLATIVSCVALLAMPSFCGKLRAIVDGIYTPAATVVLLSIVGSVAAVGVLSLLLENKRSLQVYALTAAALGVACGVLSLLAYNRTDYNYDISVWLNRIRNTDYFKRIEATFNCCGTKQQECWSNHAIACDFIVSDMFLTMGHLFVSIFLFFLGLFQCTAAYAAYDVSKAS